MNAHRFGVGISYRTVQPQDEQSGYTYTASDPAEPFVHIEGCNNEMNVEVEPGASQEAVQHSEIRRLEKRARGCNNEMNVEVEVEPGASQEAVQHSEIRRLEKRVRSLNEQLEKKSAENESLRGQVERLTKEISRLYQEGQDKDSKISNLEKELQKEQSKSYRSPKMFGRRTTNSAAVATTRRVPRKQVNYTKQPLEQNVNNVDADIMGKVHERLMKKSMDINELPWRQDRSHVPCIVFCVYASRLGNDVEEVLPKYVKESPVILVILHPVLKKHATAGTLSSTEHMLSEDTKAKVSSIVHFAFSKDQGLYNCKLNEASLKKLTEILENPPGTAL